MQTIPITGGHGCSLHRAQLGILVVTSTSLELPMGPTILVGPIHPHWVGPTGPTRS